MRTDPINGGGAPPPTPPFNGIGQGEIIRELATLKNEIKHLATREEAAEVKTLIEKNVGDLKTSIEQVKTSIEKKKSGLLLWALGIFIGAVVTLMSSAVLILVNVLTP